MVTTDEVSTPKRRRSSRLTPPGIHQGHDSELFIDAKGGTQVPHGGVEALLPDWSERLC